MDVGNRVADASDRAFLCSDVAMGIVVPGCFAGTVEHAGATTEPIGDRQAVVAGLIVEIRDRRCAIAVGHTGRPVQSVKRVRSGCATPVRAPTDRARIAAARRGPGSCVVIVSGMSGAGACPIARLRFGRLRHSGKCIVQIRSVAFLAIHNRGLCKVAKQVIQVICRGGQ